MRLVLPLTLVLVLVVGFVWFLPEPVGTPTRLEALRPRLEALYQSPGDAAMGEGRARALIKEQLRAERLTQVEFREAWDGKDPVLRWAAWLMVGDYGTPDRTLGQALERDLASPTPAQVRVVVAETSVALGPYLEQVPLARFEAAAHDDEPRVRSAALQVLVQRAPRSPQVWATLIKRLKDPDDGCQDAAATALARISFADLLAGAEPDDPQRRAAHGSVLPALREATRSDRQAVRMYATMALGRMGTLAATAVPDLVRILESDDALSQGHAATALGRIGPAALPALSKAVRDVPVRQIPMVLWALRLIGAPAEATLRDVMRSHPNDAARVVAAMKLWELDRPFDGLRPAFEAALVEGSDEARLQAARGIQRIGPAAAALGPALRRALEPLEDGKESETLRRALHAALESVSP